MGRRLYTEDYIRRKQLKGAAANDEKLKLLCEIRHQFTNYEKLIVFYNTYPRKRSELNHNIKKLIENGPDYVEVFREKVKKIEDYVNLNKKDAKKRFLQEEETRLRQANPECMERNIKEWALNNLSQVIRLNNSYRQRKRSLQNV